MLRAVTGSGRLRWLPSCRMLHTRRHVAACMAALVLGMGACSSSEPETVACADLLAATPGDDRALATTAWRNDGGAPADMPPLDDVVELCRATPDLHLGPALRAVVTAASTSTSTTAPGEPTVHVFEIRGVLRVTPIVSGAGTGGLADASERCITESVGPQEAAAMPDEPVVVTDEDQICYRLGPVLLDTGAFASVRAERDEDGAARRIGVQLSGDGVEQFEALTRDAAVATPTAPTGQLAFLLDGGLLDVTTVDEPIADGVMTLQAADGTFSPAIVDIIETMMAP